MAYLTHKFVSAQAFPYTGMWPFVSQNIGVAKPKKNRSWLVIAFAKNVTALMDLHKDTPTSGGKRCGISQQQFDRFISGAHAPTLDSLLRIAKGYGVEPYQLLIPGLDVRNPQILHLLSAEEQKLYAVLQDILPPK